MNIAIDIGNTRIHLGAYNEKGLVKKASLENKVGELPKDVQLHSFFKGIKKIEEVNIASVVEKTSRYFATYFKKHYHLEPHFIRFDTPMDMKLDCDVPEEVGPDLIADTYAAKVAYGKNVLIADLGTASKLIYLDENGNFKGVSILPGLKMGLSALYHDTDALPSIKLQKMDKAIGVNTKECILSGVIYGGAYAIQGLAKRFEEEAHFKAKKILTGGNAKYVQDLLPEFELKEDLALDGIEAIYQYNKEKTHA